MRLVILFFLGVSTACAEDMANVLPSGIELFGEEMILAHEEGESPAPILAEYIPVGESVERWSRMLAVRYYNDQQTTPAEMILNIQQSIVARKESGDPLANGAIFKSDTPQLIAYDFLISDGLSQKVSIIEHNTQWFIESKNGILHYQIAERHYVTADDPESAKAFIKQTGKRQSRNLEFAKAGRAAVPNGIQIQQIDPEGIP